MEFWVVDQKSSVTIRVVESGFASMPVTVEEQLAQHEQNTRTWQHQLELARDRLQACADEPLPTRWTEATVFADMWVDPDDDPREAGAGAVDERGVLLDNLRHYRLTLELKCAGLSAEQFARRSVSPSTMSLLGLVRHMADEERHLRRVMTGEDTSKLYCTDQYLAGVFDLTARNAGVSDLGPDGADLNLRGILMAQIAEYARHCGHADLLRERIDGRVGQ